jgi:uncharacterized protein YbjT (DUF2867 family)
MFAVTGATGKMGSTVARQLHDAGYRVRALSSRPERVRLPAGVDVAMADLSRPETLPVALEGAEAVFLYPTSRGAAEVVAAIQRSGAKRVVMLSSLAVDGDEVDERSNPIGAFHRAAERAVEQSTLKWTLLRPGAFATNALWWAPQIRADGVVRGAYPDAASTPIHEADIAAVAMCALTGSGHVGQVYPMTGPTALTQAEQARLIGDAIGRPVTFERISVEEAAQAMSAGANAPEPVIRSILAMQAASVGNPGPVYPTVAEVTGGPARTFAEWATDHSADFS